jgi:hypothetical protein
MNKSETIGELAKALCQCGCGNPAPIATFTSPKHGRVKGEPCRFISGHNAGVGKDCISWKGGKCVSEGRSRTYIPDHPKAQKNGYVLDSVLVAEKALGRPLPPKAVVHHYRKLSDDSAIVICENQGYHNLIHRRTRAYRGCGNANWLKCSYCQQYDSPENLYVIKNERSSANHHVACKTRHDKSRRAK